MSEEKTNREVILVARPGVNGHPEDSNFAVQGCAFPDHPPSGKFVVIKTLYLSVDPAQRCQMNESTGVEYLKPNEIGQRVQGLGGVGLVLETGPEVKNLVRGQLITNTKALSWPWAEFFAMEEDGFDAIPSDIANLHIPLAYLGVVGLTSYLGMREKGKVKPGDTVVISGAAGACGTLAGQFAKLFGAQKVVGICGTDEKCCYIVDELGFTHSVNYKQGDFDEKLAECCEGGVDVYFDNVGGEISRKIVVEHMRSGGRIVLCGQIADYNRDVPYPPPIPDDMAEAIANKSIERERFLVLAYKDKFPSALEEMKQFYVDGKIRIAITVTEGLEKAGSAFVSMMNGGNTGKQLVKVADYHPGDME